MERNGDTAKDGLSVSGGGDFRHKVFAFIVY